ncbi:DUF4231 domain-containing protein [Micromonospora endophytica]|uniref:DUF4231 domain-containing protein n=1 Tax=Micromonospora endophytica TaxID=515350 RepID=UPI001C32FD46|nr:DUF4231 domain-containing protein [Micromonospora endophytica]BCJ59721.1 hypothetical protein Jiend_31430 [Micromonospora endophytica]
MQSRISRFWRRSGSTNEAKWLDIISDGSQDWHPDYIRSQILDAEEKLHLQILWRKAGIVWIFLVNTALIAAAIAASFSAFDQLSQFSSELYIACAVSLLASPALAYLQYKRMRNTRIIIKKLHVVRRRTQAEQDRSTSSGNDSALLAQKRYRDDVPDLVSQFREDAGRTRGIHNRFQSVIIVGSVATSAIATASVSFSQARWATVAASAAVGLAAGFTGYFKYHERSFNSQQTADAIEREYEAVELRVGKYAKLNDAEAYTLFAECVERLRDEQNKRQQQLDQPAEVKREE